MTPNFFESPAAFRAWLVEHHQTKTELIVGFHKRATGKPSMTWSESVDQALCFGWIDGVRRSVDATRYCIRFTPRKTTSIWSAINIAKIAALEKAGLMTEAGRRAYAHRRPDKTGIYSFERSEAAKLQGAEAKALAANAKAAEFFGSRAPWYQRAATHWVVSAKTPETRARRLAQLISDSAAGRTIPPLTRKK